MKTFEEYCDKNAGNINGLSGPSIWNAAQAEMQLEIDRLIEEVKFQTGKQVEATCKLSEKQDEIDRLRGECREAIHKAVELERSKYVRSMQELEAWKQLAFDQNALKLPVPIIMNTLAEDRLRAELSTLRGALEPIWKILAWYKLNQPTNPYPTYGYPNLREWWIKFDELSALAQSVPTKPQVSAGEGKNDL